MIQKPTLALLLALTFFGCQNHQSQEEKKPQKPNIIYVMADQLRYDMMGYADNHQAITPHLDRMAQEGINFANCVSVTPVCAPHRASLITGKYSSSTGMVINEIRMNPNHKTIAHVLTENAYQTGFIGEWHLWANIAGHHGQFETAYIPPGPHRMGFDGYWAAYNFNHRNFNGYYYMDDTVRDTYKKTYEPEAQFDMVMDFMER